MQASSAFATRPAAQIGLAANAPTRTLAGVRVPDTPLVARAIDHARAHLEPYLFHHAMRSWLFAVLLADQTGAPYDDQVLAIAALLHDLGLARAFDGPLRFEVEGANAARTFARDAGMDERRCQLVWDAVALNATPSIGLHKEIEAALCALGVGVDWGGWAYDAIEEADMARILATFPRLGFKHYYAHAVCRIAQARPHATYEGFARDFGERFVPGYRAPSMVDALLESPFEE